MLRTLPFLLLALLLATTPATAQKADPAASGNLEVFSGTDAAMNAAIAQAQASLPLFLARVLDGDGRASTGSLKVSFQTFPTDVGDEIIWVGQFQRLPDGSFTGVLNNQPFNLGNWQMGELVAFPASAIQDWSLAGPQGLYGNYTTRVIAAQPGNGHIFQSLAPDPVPAAWR